MDFFVWSTIVLGIWGALGPLFGVRYGQELAKRWQKEHWSTDNKKQEYREVLQALSAAVAPLLQCEVHGVSEWREVKAAMAAENTSYEVFESRLFIADELEGLEARDRWVKSVGGLKKEKDEVSFLKEYHKLAEDIRAAAIGSMRGL